MGVGIVTAGTVVLPLDRRVLLLMGNIGDDDAVWQGTTRLARDAIELVATNARRSVFHHPDDADILNGVELPQPREYEIDVGDSLERFMAPDGWPPRAESGESPQEPRA
jgi:hypothetical protein